MKRDKIMLAVAVALILAAVAYMCGCSASNDGIQPIASIPPISGADSATPATTWQGHGPLANIHTKCAVCSLLTGMCYDSPWAKNQAESDWKLTHGGGQ